MVIEDLKNIRGKIAPGDIYMVAKDLMKPEDIDHYATDLYLRKTPESDALRDKFEFPGLVLMFKSNIEPYDLWYEYPFCYIPEAVREEEENETTD